LKEESSRATGHQRKDVRKNASVLPYERDLVFDPMDVLLPKEALVNSTEIGRTNAAQRLVSARLDVNFAPPHEDDNDGLAKRGGHLFIGTVLSKEVGSPFVIRYELNRCVIGSTAEMVVEMYGEQGTGDRCVCRGIVDRELVLDVG
jgi:hypothetical protein